MRSRNVDLVLLVCTLDLQLPGTSLAAVRTAQPQDGVCHEQKPLIVATEGALQLFSASCTALQKCISSNFEQMEAAKGCSDDAMMTKTTLCPSACNMCLHMHVPSVDQEVYKMRFTTESFMMSEDIIDMREPRSSRLHLFQRSTCYALTLHRLAALVPFTNSLINHVTCRGKKIDALLHHQPKSTLPRTA